MVRYVVHASPPSTAARNARVSAAAHGTVGAMPPPRSTSGRMAPPIARPMSATIASVAAAVVRSRPSCSLTARPRSCSVGPGMSEQRLDVDRQVVATLDARLVELVEQFDDQAVAGKEGLRVDVEPGPQDVRAAMRGRVRQLQFV